MIVNHPEARTKKKQQKNFSYLNAAIQNILNNIKNIYKYLGHSFDTSSNLKNRIIRYLNTFILWLANIGCPKVYTHLDSYKGSAY